MTVFWQILIATLLSQAAVVAQEWWPRIHDEFEGVLTPPLRQCRRKKLTSPQTGDKCVGNKPKTCFFGSQECDAVGAHPVVRCVCTGSNTKGKTGTWTCADETCPQPPPTTTGTPILIDDTFAAPAEPGFFRSSKASPFDVTMKLLTPAVLNGYNTTQELCDDLNQTVRFYVNALIDEQSRDYNDFLFLREPVLFDSQPLAVASDSSTAAGARPSAEGATDFQTNNQEEGVDEADAVKSDGTYVYAAYGDVLVIWDAITGESITNYTLPPVQQIDSSGGDFVGGIFFRPIFFFQPKPQIVGLSLEAQRLVLYVQGYGPEVRASATAKSAFSNAFETRIVVLDTSTLPGSIDVVTQTDIHGSYRDARAIGTDIHVVTTCSLDYYSLVAYPLYRWNPEFSGLNSSEYVAVATAMAIPLIDNFVTALKDDVILLGMPNIPQISIWQTDLGNNTNIVESIYSSGAVQSFVQLTSFSVAGLTGNLSLSTAGAFTPSEWGYTYAVEGNLVFAAQGYNWAPSFGGSSETTYLLGFKLNGASAKPSFLGSVPGYINNQYFLNIYNGTMSIATTVSSWWPVWVEQQDEFGNIIWPSPIFTTNNSVYVYSLPTATEPLSEVGRVENLGKEGERFTAVRFFRNICYAVTFRQTDPFYVISTDPNDVRLLGELQISGFSSYLHSINADDTLLVAVGQDADETGRVLGVQISLFDATNPVNPTLLHRDVVESESDVWSSSTVQWDYKAFRYLPLGPDFGIVIIPLTVVAWSQENLDGNFDGFLAYDVSRENGISQRLNVTHVQSQDFYGCYYAAYLPERSLVFNGNLTTIKGHSAVSTDLDSSETRWTLNMAKPIQETDCVYWLY